MLLAKMYNTEKMLGFIQKHDFVRGLYDFDRVRRRNDARNAAGETGSSGIVQRGAGGFSSSALFESLLVPWQPR